MARRKRFFAGSVAAITISFFRKRNPCNASNVVADVEKLGFVLGAVGGRSRRREKLSGLLSGLPLGPSDPPLLSAHAPFRNTSTRPLATRREPQSPPPVPMQGILPSRVISGFLSRWGAAPGVGLSQSRCQRGGGASTPSGSAGAPGTARTTCEIYIYCRASSSNFHSNFSNSPEVGVISRYNTSWGY